MTEIDILKKKLEIAEKALNNIGSFGYADDHVTAYALEALAKMSKLDGE